MKTPDLLKKYRELCEARRAQIAAEAPLLRAFHGALSEQVLLDFLDAQCIALHTDSLGYRHLLALPGPLWIVSEDSRTGSRPLDPAETIAYTHATLHALKRKAPDPATLRRTRRLLWYLENGPDRGGIHLNFAFFQSPSHKAWAIANPQLFTRPGYDSLVHRLRLALQGTSDPEAEPLTLAPFDTTAWQERAEASVNWPANPLPARSRAEMELYLAWKTTKIRSRRPLPENREEVIAQVFNRDWRLEFILPDHEPAGIGEGASLILAADDFANHALPVENAMMYKEEAIFRPEEIRTAAALLEQATRLPGADQFTPRLLRMCRFVALLDLIDHLRAGRPWHSQKSITGALESWDLDSRDASLMAELFESLAPKEFHSMIPARHLSHLQRIAQARHANRDYSQDTYGKHF